MKIKFYHQSKGYTGSYLKCGFGMAYRKNQKIGALKVLKTTTDWAGGQNLSPIVSMGPPPQVQTVGELCK